MDEVYSDFSNSHKETKKNNTANISFVDEKVSFDQAKSQPTELNYSEFDNMSITVKRRIEESVPPSEITNNDSND